MLVILRTGYSFRPGYQQQQSAYLQGMSILNTSSGLRDTRPQHRSAYLPRGGLRGTQPRPQHRVTSMALDRLRNMRRKTQKVKNVDDRVGVIAKYILAGEMTGDARILAGYATNDYCGTEYCIDPHDSEGELAAIHDYVQWNVRYMEDPVNHDTYDSADRSIELAFGDCDDIAIVSGAMYLHAGFPVRIKVIRTLGNSDFHHVYLLVGTPKAAPNKWTPSDAAYYDYAGEEAPGIEAQKIYELN